MRKLIQKIRDYRDRKFLERMNRAQAYKERNKERNKEKPTIYQDVSGAYVVEADGFFRRSI